MIENKHSVLFHNNFGFLRLILSICVIFSHSFALTSTTEPIYYISGNKFNLGDIAVECFFVLSGYLIFQSVLRSKSYVGYYWKRLLRIFPGLIIALLFTLLVLALVYYDQAIWNQSDYWRYFINNASLYKVQFYIQNVFENNPYPKAINGSLWSLKYEFTMYIIFSAFYFLKANKRTSFLILCGMFILAYLCHNLRPNTLGNLLHAFTLKSSDFWRLLMFFNIGCLLTFLNLNTINTVLIRTLLFGLFVVSIFFGLYTFVGGISLAISIILFGIVYTKGIGDVDTHIGDISYGLYIYSFLIQQVLMYYFDMNIYMLFISSLILTAAISFISWHFVEKKCLKFKNFIN